MKRPWIFLLVLSIAISLLVSCYPGGAQRPNCSHGGEVCVSLSTVKSFAKGGTIPLKITVTSSKDISSLHITIHTNAEITMDGPQTWEKDISNPTNDRGFANWDFAIKAGQTRTFNRVLHLPQKQGYFNVTLDVAGVDRIIDAQDSFYVVLSDENGGQAIFAGTPFPHLTPKVTPAVYGPGTPKPTIQIEPTSTPEATPIPLHETTPVGPPYPQPSPPAFPLVPTSSSYP